MAREKKNMIVRQPGEFRNGLRACPFCGKHGTVTAILEADGNTVIRCDPSRGTGGCGASTAPFQTKAEAADAWNRRTYYTGKCDFERLGWPYNLVAEIFGSDDEMNGVELTEDQQRGIEYALGTLTDRERDCVLRYYKDGLTLEGLASEQRVTRERVRQVITKAERKLRHPARAKYITRGYAVVSGEVAERARAAYQAEVDRVKEQMLAEARAEVQRKIAAEQAGMPIAKDEPKWNVMLSEMELSVRSHNCLARALGRNATAADVFAVKEPMKIRNLGVKSAMEVAGKLKELGFTVLGSAWEQYES